MIQKTGIITILFFLLLPSFVVAQTATKAIDYRGQILLQQDSYGQAWYIKDSQRYYLPNSLEILDTVKKIATTISVKNWLNYKKYAGQFTKVGQDYYFVSLAKKKFAVKTAKDVNTLLVTNGKPVKTAIINRYSMNNWQLYPDTVFSGVAYASLENNKVLKKSNADLVLPLASLTKLMTALVLLDTKPDWSEPVVVQQEDLDYPKSQIGEDTSSEVDLRVGDQIKKEDLWVAMLVASSNQAAAILVRTSGLTKKDFVRQMNAKAEQLELVKTKFSEFAGLDVRNVSTAREMAVIAQVAFERSTIANTSVIKNYNIRTINKNRIIKVINRNYSLLQFEPVGAKTGFLVEAQRNVSIKKKERIIVVLHARSMGERNSIIQQLQPARQYSIAK
ncbi:MAG: hypothetical protein COX77_00815 [Candidatus Komeilibacteria bacterium CG_4_10_14_0_2_um_filter_37_10]|uniref:Peptidase S11 D-alanyl-D-alanine carboxypeptidase A N-terminal domain-containing protein n=1 Tax=Candidatus Komeilibacteria bacterium CG_4_10_14_0_2_um_filter_37_10 TaxID=1974470 RepID=A0A2M7VGB1_9BACT|nr:MAG: hypothetical protein COX77_00815 [Candidatus Komeilibacteria bacterium CG_4_10_14_0_2_um_filter_37_10]PJA94103.1 MAG: hypothetical protein CO133_00735 [Candidatus Komeilibacteria bacterium CG_4_9_14_3_um_filter_37_5]